LGNIGAPTTYMRKFVLTKISFLVTRHSTLVILVIHVFVTRQVTMDGPSKYPSSSNNAKLMQIARGLLDRAHKKSATERKALNVNCKHFKI